MFSAQDLHELLLSVVYSGIGMIVFAIFFLIAVKFAPFPVIKEIAEDQNTALAILMGSVVIGLSIIIAAAII